MNAFESLVRRYVRLSLDQPWGPLVAIAVLTALAVLAGRSIEINTDLKSLLPEDAPSVQALEEARTRRGSTDNFVIAVESPNPEATARFIDDLAARLEAWDESESVSVSEDQSFFRDHVLLYLQVDELERIHDNVRRMIREAQGRENPLFVDLEASDDEPATDWHDSRVWISDAALDELGIARDEIGSLLPFLDDEAEPAADVPVSPPTAEEVEAARIRAARDALPEQYDDYRFSPDGRVAVVMARLAGRSTDIEYARSVYEWAERTITELDPSSYDPELRAEVSGAYRSFLEVRQVVSDMSTATSISIGLVLVLLIGFFRNLRSVVIVLTPLLCGVAWTLGLIDLVYGELNTLTAFVFAMLIGMGIDFGIHIYRRAQEEFHAGLDWEEAVTISITRTGRALLTATLTTVGALLTLTLAHFDGFKEFGIACGAGVALCLVAAVVVAPPLIGAFEKALPSKRRPPKADDGGGGRGVLLAVRIGAVIVAAVALWGATEARHVQFEYDFDNLEAPRDPDRIRYGQAIGRNRGSAPAIVLGESEEQMRAVHQVLRDERLREDGLIKSFVTVESLVPSGQDERMEVILDLYDTLDGRAVRNLGDDEREMADALRELTEVESFGADELPEHVRESLTERDGTFGSLGIIYGDYDSSDAREVMAFQEEFANIELPEGRVLVSSNGFIIADVVRYVQADGLHLGVYVALCLLVILFIDLRKPVGVIACLATLGAGILLTVAGMVVFDVKIGLYNMVVLPTVLGVGIDGSIHVYHRYLEEGRERLPRVMRTTGVAVIASSVTTAAGFFGLLLVEHRGVITIGALSVIGIIASLVAVVTLLPAVLSWVGRVHSSDVGH